MKTIEMSRIKADHNGHFFDAGALRFFSARLPRYGYESASGARYFVTSEQFKAGGVSRWEQAGIVDGPRLYTLRVQCADGSIDTWGEFQAYRSSETAREHAKRLARGGEAA